MTEFPTFREFMEKPEHTPVDKLLVAAIARLTLFYSTMTPEDCYRIVLKRAQQVEQSND